MLNLERLRVLHAVFTYGSVQGAADSLHVSPSAVSQQIAKLEREVGEPLLDRNGRGVRLSDAALLLANRTSTILREVELLDGELDSFRNVVSGTLRISAFPTAARGIGPKLINQLRAGYPDLKVTLSEQEPTESFPMLQRGDVDVVIAQDWFNAPIAVPEGLSRMALFDDTADIALHVGHRLAHRRTVKLSDLRDEEWVTWPSGSICHEWLSFTLRSMGHEPKIAHTASEHATQLALVAAGLGPAVIPRLGRDSVPDTVRMVAVEPHLQRHLFATWRTESSKRSAIGAVVGALTDLSKTRRDKRSGDRAVHNKP